MARIVPAKPRSETPSEEAALLALESDLDDDFVVFQRFPEPGLLLMVHPDKGACAILCADGPRKWDADAESWEGAEPSAATTSALRTLVPQGKVPLMVFLPDTPEPPVGSQGRAGAAFSAAGGSLSDAVSRAASAGPVLGEDGVGALIVKVSDGAAPYARGTVTSAQAQWRARAREESSSVPAAAEPFVPFPEPVGNAPPAFPEVRREAPPPQPARPDDLSLDHPTILLLRQVAETVAAGRSIFVQGVDITPMELTEPGFLLPALLVAAAEDWAPVVVSADGKGGFHVRLRSDPEAMLGYRLVALEQAAPLLLVLPVVDRIRRAVRRMPDGREEIGMDETVQRFVRWLEANRLDGSAIGVLDLRIALQMK
jgi:hypothetical protein